MCRKYAQMYSKIEKRQNINSQFNTFTLNRNRQKDITQNRIGSGFFNKGEIISKYTD